MPQNSAHGSFCLNITAATLTLIETVRLKSHFLMAFFLQLFKLDGREWCQPWRRFVWWEHCVHASHSRTATWGMMILAFVGMGAVIRYRCETMKVASQS